MKTSGKYFRVAVGPRSGTSSRKWPKTYLTYDVIHKKTENQNQKDLLSLLKVWTALYIIGLRAMQLVRQPQCSCFFLNFQVW